MNDTKRRLSMSSRRRTQDAAGFSLSFCTSKFGRHAAIKPFPIFRVRLLNLAYDKEPNCSKLILIGKTFTDNKVFLLRCQRNCRKREVKHDFNQTVAKQAPTT